MGVYRSYIGVYIGLYRSYIGLCKVVEELYGVS